jgi:DNA-binding transcriptional regulator YiaG
MVPGTDYHYTACGLDNVVLKGLPVMEDDGGDQVITIPKINLLHQLLVNEVATKHGRLNGKEIRFLRTELGMSQSQLAVLVGRDAQSVGRWERGEADVEQALEMVIRMKALEYVNVERPSVDDVAEWTQDSTVQPAILIDAHDPNNYRPIAA